MAGSGRWSGWVSFAGLLMILIGGISFFEGLIAVIRKQYYVLTPETVIVFNVKTWGWIGSSWASFSCWLGWRCSREPLGRGGSRSSWPR